jgi:hypothetical protein
MIRTLALEALIAAALALPAFAAQHHPAVDVTSAVKVLVARDTPALLVAYRYDFRGRQTVYIKGLGVVPARGEFEYITQEPRVHVRTAPDGAVLADVPLKETVIVAAKPPLNAIPGEAEFPPGFRSDTWPSAVPLRDRLNSALRKHFSYLPRDEDSLNYTVTTFTPLQVDQMPAGTTAQVALLISFPHDVATGQYAFRVRSLVHEGRPLSDKTRPTSNPVIQRAADAFVVQLIKDIKAGALRP